MGGIRIEGTSSNVADVTSNNNLKVALPTAAAQVGSVRLMSECDAGTITGTPTLRSPETTIDYRLRVGMDTMLDYHYFQETQFAINKFRFQASTAQAASTGGYLTLNSNSSLNYSWIYIDTINVFQAYSGNAPLYCETYVRIDESVNSFATFEFGLSGLRDASGPYDALDGAFFRLTSSGLIGVVKVNTVQTTTAVMLGSLTLGQNYQCGIVFGNKEVQFFVDDIMYVVPLTTGLAFPVNIPGVRWFGRYHQSATGTSVSKLKIGGYNIQQGDISPMYTPAVLAALSGGSMYIQQGNSGGPAANYTVGASAAPPTATLTANTAPAYNNLQAYWTYPSALSVGEAEYPIIAFSPADAAASTASRNFICVGIDVGDITITSAVTGGALVMQWFCAFRSSGSALNTTESSGYTNSTRGPRSIPMRSQVIPASATAGTTISGFRYDLSASPLVIAPDDFLHVYIRIHAGTNITASGIRQTCAILGYFA
jgi:hypothetical protein